jgi:L-threonylcarbamoyladenylate synthase
LKKGEPVWAPPFFIYFCAVKLLILIMEKGTDIRKAAEILRNGGLVAFPTETVYGLGANGLDPLAVARIYEVKQRPSFDPLILHVGYPTDTGQLFRSPEDTVIRTLIQHFWPGPLTIVAEKQPAVPGIVTSGLSTVAVRMPQNDLALELIRTAGIPVAAPSANLFGRLSPTMPQHVMKQLKGVDYLVDGGKTSIGVESTIVSVTGTKIILLRPGAITSDQIREALPEAEVIKWNTPVNETEGLSAPGLMNSHYSPEKPLYIFEKFPGRLKPGSGVICFTNPELPADHAEAVIVLSPGGDLREAAANLFTALHDLENNPFIHRIFIEQMEEKGIGVAIMDRLRKAAFRHGNQG